MENQQHSDLQSKTTGQEPKALSSIELNSKLVEVSCDRHGTSTVEVFKIFLDWSPATCPGCDREATEQEVATEDDFKSRQALRAKQRDLEGRIRRSGIPERFEDRSFENYHVLTEGSKRAKEICLDYARNFPDRQSRGTSMIFCGNAGTGKTHLACAIANHIIHEHDRSAVFLKVAKAIRMVKETYNKKSERSEQDAINWFGIPDLLILDEVGVQFGTEAEKYILFEIINERYESLKPTILLSNLALDPKRDGDSSLRAFAGERVIDRMKENGGRVIAFDWLSHRGKA